MGFWDEVRANVKELEKLRSQPSIKLEYIGGHPEFKKPKSMVIRKGFNSKELYLDDKHVVHVTDLEWEERAKRSAGKAAAGAIIGGVLTGGIGLVAGAAIGGRKHDDSKVIIETDEGYSIYLRCKDKEFASLAALLY